jgi:hypothetical protein
MSQQGSGDNKTVASLCQCHRHNSSMALASDTSPAGPGRPHTSSWSCAPSRPRAGNHTNGANRSCNSHLIVMTAPKGTTSVQLHEWRPAAQYNLLYAPLRFHSQPDIRNNNNTRTNGQANSSLQPQEPPNRSTAYIQTQTNPPTTNYKQTPRHKPTRSPCAAHLCATKHVRHLPRRRPAPPSTLPHA